MEITCQQNTYSRGEHLIGEPDRVLAAFLGARFADAQRPVLAAVGGPGGTGKSTFACALVEALGRDSAVVLGLDCYKKPRHFRAEKNIFGPHPDANEMQMIRSDLLRLGRGQPIEKPCYCSQRGRICDYERFEPARFVIVEGEVSTYPVFGDAIDFSIFIDSHWKTQLNTRIGRDIEHRGYTPEKAIATFLHSNLREFAVYGSVSKDMCDVHLHCDDAYTLVIDAVAQQHLLLMQTVHHRLSFSQTL